MRGNQIFLAPFLLNFIYVSGLVLPCDREEEVTMQKVLIVDDNAIFRELLRETLYSRFPSLIIYEAKDGKEALEQAGTFHPDLIFIDIGLPDKNGLEVTRLIKDQNPGVGVVILTNDDQLEYREAASHIGVDHFVSKDSFMSLIGIISSKNPLADRL